MLDVWLLPGSQLPATASEAGSLHHGLHPQWVAFVGKVVGLEETHLLEQGLQHVLAPVTATVARDPSETQQRCQCAPLMTHWGDQRRLMNADWMRSWNLQGI